jgi:cyclic beta-1,2-glucan synthetase
LLQLTFIANEAYERAHAIVLTLVRLTATQRRLLQWETAAASGARGASLATWAGARLFLVEMIASPVLALVGLVLIWSARPSALPTALPVLALWAVAPFIAYLLSRPVEERKLQLSAEDHRFLLQVARDTWRYFERFMGAEDSGLPPDNFQETPEPRVAHRTSPTNIAMGLLGTLAAHDLGFIRTDELARRIDAALTTIEGLERFEGHLLNWYDTISLAPLPPSYVSTVDSGNLAGALIALAEGLRQLSRQPQTEAARSTQSAADYSGHLDELARRAAAFADGMNFRFLYDPQRRILSIGYRLADAGGPGRLDPSFYDLLASEARLASFIAIAKGDVPETHWFHLGRLITSVDGTPTLCRGARRCSST